MLPCWFYLPLFPDYIMCSGEKWGDPPVPAVSPPTSLGWGGWELLVPALPSWHPPPPFLKDPGIWAPSPLPPALVPADKASGCLSVVPAWGRPGGGPGLGRAPGSAGSKSRRADFVDPESEGLCRVGAGTRPPSSAQRPAQTDQRLQFKDYSGDVWGSGSTHTRNTPAVPGEPNLLRLCSGPWSLAGRGQRLGQESPQPRRDPTMESVQKQWPKVVSAYQYVLTFLFMGPFFSLLVLFLLFTSFWSVSVLYLVWFLLDWDTPNQGGRRFEWTRNWAVWKHARDYYPIKLVKTAELPPDRNYVLGGHPHGIMCIGTFCNFSTEANNFSKQFPGIQVSSAALASLFHFPIYRDYIMSYGICSVNRWSLDFVLSQRRLGQAVIIMVGGAQESLYAIPGKHCLILRNRKGFVRLALRHGASLVPVYSFGENDVFNFKVFATNSWQYMCQITFKKIMGFVPCIFWGHGLFSANSWGLVPFARPITTVVGRPIPVPQRLDPTEEEVDHYHMLYLEALEQLFEDHKESCGVPASTHLTFI
ncbi:2-acylglycerol O-acyltransferase 3 isoform X1 [Mirounga angustirostris]|uniref:2-acylglycerol O-acyltransferase 3 isoform X1 n=1 Tax=Mirounga angustirostris TaxID=9716 RepID=UPI0023E3E80C|nr:2-acylglycerol O-acyltransferase 3 isoform X1 [Mirounga angustirostris]